MKRKAIVLSLTFVFVMAGIATIIPFGTDDVSAAGITVTDSKGKEITLAEPVQKVAVFGTGFVVTVDELGFKDSIVLIDTYTRDSVDGFNDHDGYSFTGGVDDYGQKLMDGQGGFVKTRDVVITYNYTSYGTSITALENTYGLTVVALNASNYNDVISVTSTIGKLFGIADEDNVSLQKLNDAKTKYTDKLTEEGVTEFKKVLYITNTSGNIGDYKVGTQTSYTGVLMTMAGGINVADPAKTGSSYAIDASEIIRASPDIIYVDGNYPDSIAKLRSDLSIGSDVQVYKLGKLMNNYSSTAVDGIDMMAKTMYPEIFGEYDGQDEGDNPDTMWYIAAGAAAIILVAVLALVLLRRN